MAPEKIFILDIPTDGTPDCENRISQHRIGSDYIYVIFNSTDLFFNRTISSGLDLITFTFCENHENWPKERMSVLPAYKVNTNGSQAAAIFLSGVNDNNQNLFAHGQYNVLKFTPIIRKILNTDNAINIFIGFPKYYEIPYVNSEIQTIAKSRNPLLKNCTVLEIRPKSFIVEIETEVFTLTVTDIISAFGGFNNSIKAFYVILFGAGLISPWGCIQSFPGVKKNVKKEFRKDLVRIFPKDDEKTLKEDYLKQGLYYLKEDDEKLKELEKRHEELELFLKEYVVDIDKLLE
ncbi:14661_t:CDS:2 [Ambispora leptoticha]|uniref:14661_t:CDS:1 n=1 Tax=Ambispora leptoticha TaxID=144679 RepID=A0A9N9FJ47_9GLOM|nr:14661_t:CDS:2 [Ambispora leptoticha]